MNILDIKEQVQKLKLSGDIQSEVVDNDDPKGFSRVKVSIVGWTDEIDKELLPLYVIAYPISSSPNTPAGMPRIGSRVLVEFQDDDIYNGVVVKALPVTPPDGAS